jgi:hypothetical protein
LARVLIILNWLMVAVILTMLIALAERLNAADANRVIAALRAVAVLGRDGVTWRSR